eukprot:1156113-Pelagomonas_calceolata.AAC.2
MSDMMSPTGVQDGDESSANVGDHQPPKHQLSALFRPYGVACIKMICRRNLTVRFQLGCLAGKSCFSKLPITSRKCCRRRSSSSSSEGGMLNMAWTCTA